jgi:hypothetical protein
VTIIRAGDAVISTTEERDRRLREWAEREALAAEQMAKEAERTAQAWRDAATGLRKLAKELKHE